MHATICKWGNSLALRLPKTITDGAKLVEGSTVDLAIENGIIRVTPRRPKFKLADLLVDSEVCAEVDWGERQGDEM